MAKLAKVLRVLGFGILGVSVIGTLIGAVSCVFASSPDLSSADRARIQANGLAEALYNVAFGVIVGGALLLASRWAKARSAPPTA